MATRTLFLMFLMALAASCGSAGVADSDTQIVGAPASTTTVSSARLVRIESSCSMSSEFAELADVRADCQDNLGSLSSGVPLDPFSWGAMGGERQLIALIVDGNDIDVASDDTEDVVIDGNVVVLVGAREDSGVTFRIDGESFLCRFSNVVYFDGDDVCAQIPDPAE